MDKTALNYANLFGYQAALGLKGQQFNYLSSSSYTIRNWRIPQFSDASSSALRWLFLRSIPVRMAHWPISRTESAGN
jgi:hypothetical protein